MALSAIDNTDLQDALLNDASNGTYGRFGVARGVRNYLPVGINSSDALYISGATDSSLDLADAYAKDLSTGTRDRFGVSGRHIKHAVMNNGKTVNRTI